MFKGVNVCVYVGDGLRRSFATPDPFVLTNKICLNQNYNGTRNANICHIGPTCHFGYSQKKDIHVFCALKS